MKILIACEFTGLVREEFRRLGHDAWSCDLLPTEIPGQHLQKDVLEILDHGWDMMIGFPPCTRLCVSGARWFKDKKQEQKDGIDFFMKLANAPIKKIGLENPIGIMSTIWREPDQIIQPWWFGHGEVKSTCLWLKNLPELYPTRLVKGREQKIHKMSKSPTRSKDRSRTYPGIAKAMAEQWSNPKPFQLFDQP